MPDHSNHTWLDASFAGAVSTDKDTTAQLRLVEDDIIGIYSMPIIYNQEESTISIFDININYFQEFNSQSGIENVSVGYNTSEYAKINGVAISLVEFNNDFTLSSGTLNKPIIYTTGYHTVSGSLDKYAIFTSGRERSDFQTVLSNFNHAVSNSGIEDWWVNYTDFSGNLTTSGTPIPFYYEDYSFIAEYGSDLNDYYRGERDNIVDISFAGWITFSLCGDIYSVIEGFNSGYKLEAITISGGVIPHYMDVYSTIVSSIGVEHELYCALIEHAYLNVESETINGRIGYIETDVYSTAKKEIALTMNVDLLSLKISNFSLAPGEYTTSSGFISVDITDDECPVSTSGTYFVVDDNRLPVTFSGIEDGYRMFYDPIDDFISIEGVTIFTVHAENKCEKVLEQDFYLTSGYIVEYINRQELLDSIDYGFQQKIIVRVTAENYASCPQVSSLAWDFESKPQANVDLGASIVGRFHAWEYNEMPAEIYPHSTAYFYGKQFKVVVKAKDFAGNQMEPLVLNYRIEGKP